MGKALSFRPNAGMIFPTVEVAELGGRRFRLLELRVRDVGRLERECVGIFGHPFAGLEGSLEALANKGGLERGELLRHVHLLMDRGNAWPPSYGSAEFAEASSSELGCNLFLATMLRRTNGPMTDDEVLDVSAAMTAPCWETLNRIAWGIPDWAEFGADPGSSPGRGVRWSEEVFDMFAAGHSFESVGRMFITQFIVARSGGGYWAMRPRDLTPSGTA